MRNSLLVILLVLFSSSLMAQPQAATDTSVLTISKYLDDIVVVQNKAARFVAITPTTMTVDMKELARMPKFLGTSDPIRYLQSLSGIQTNNETTSGIHVQGCDDYQSLVSINGAPIYYPNHLMGLFSTFNAPHFSSIQIEQAAHKGQMCNRIGGMVDLQTNHQQPPRFSFTGNLGLVNADLTMTIPCGKKSALWISGRTSFIDLIYGKWLKFDDIQLGYNFQDYNLTYSYHPTKSDELLFTGFYSRDRLKVSLAEGSTVVWQNVMGNIRWTHEMTTGTWVSQVDFSGFDNRIRAKMEVADIATTADFASLDAQTYYHGQIVEQIDLAAGVEYHHYFTQPLEFGMNSSSIASPAPRARRNADEVSAFVDVDHSVAEWFDYSVGLHASIYAVNKRVFGAVEPRTNFRFHINENHHLTLHGGLYSQYFHKSGLTNGGLPTDFFFLADQKYSPERSIAANLNYQGQFYNNQYAVSAEIYFKQIYDVVESTANVIELVNQNFDYERGFLHANGRNYGLNFMFQRKYGIITGYISYSLGWAKRQIPELDGSKQYIYAASHERRHDLNIVLNAQPAKKWNIGAMFVLASGLPYTKAEKAYMLNGQMFCRYSTFNGAHMPIYHRLDLTCSYDIIQTKDHTFGINVSLYNTYCHRNAQFVIYRENNLKPEYGSMLSIIIPSISIYGTF